MAGGGGPWGRLDVLVSGDLRQAGKWPQSSSSLLRGEDTLPVSSTLNMHGTDGTQRLGYRQLPSMAAGLSPHADPICEARGRGPALRWGPLSGAPMEKRCGPWPEVHTQESKGQACPSSPGPVGSTHPAFVGGGAGSPLALAGLCGEGVGDGDGDDEKDRDLAGSRGVRRAPHHPRPKGQLLSLGWLLVIS